NAIVEYLVDLAGHRNRISAFVDADFGSASQVFHLRPRIIGGKGGRGEKENKERSEHRYVLLLFESLACRCSLIRRVWFTGPTAPSVHLRTPMEKKIPMIPKLSVVTAFVLLALPSGFAQDQPGKHENVPIYRVTVVQRTLDAVNYRYRNGPTRID